MPAKSTGSKLKVILLITIPVALVVLFVAYQLTGFGYTVARLRCGRNPVVAPSFFGSKSYYTPDSSLYRFYAHDSGNSYFCSEADAQSAGFNK